MIYEIMLPVMEEAVISTNYFKFVGIFCVVGIFIYLKWFRKGDEREEVERRDLANKHRQMERGRGQSEQTK